MERSSAAEGWLRTTLRRERRRSAGGSWPRIRITAESAARCWSTGFALAADYPWIERVQVNTTQLVQGFFERHGFVAVSSEAGGYGPGLDHVRLSRRLGGGR